MIFLARRPICTGAPVLAISSPCLSVGVCVVSDLGIVDVVVVSCDAEQFAIAAETAAEGGSLNDDPAVVGSMDGHAHVVAVAGTDDAVPRGHRADAD